MIVGPRGVVAQPELNGERQQGGIEAQRGLNDERQQGGMEAQRQLDSLSTRVRTRTQVLQQQVNDRVSQIRELENQLMHERVHHNVVAAQKEHSNDELVRELGKKINEVEDLRRETAGLRKQLESGENTEMYPMNAVPPHGKAIVIVNDKFEPNPQIACVEGVELRDRPGAEEDMRLFKEMFELLQYSVECHANLTGAQMHEVIRTAAAENHDAYDSFVCCVSTHGDEHVMYGSDCVGAIRSELIQYVKQAESLNRKPKMFFLQACRTKADSTAAANTYPTYYPDAADRDADVFVANASTAHNASYRSHVTGSWFVMALHYVFRLHYHHLTLDDMMHKVNNLVCDARGVIQDGGPQTAGEQQQEARQCAETTSSFRMGLRFKFLTPSPP
jgi:hypothetical protein